MEAQTEGRGAEPKLVAGARRRAGAGEPERGRSGDLSESERSLDGLLDKVRTAAAVELSDFMLAKLEAQGERRKIRGGEPPVPLLMMWSHTEAVPPASKRSCGRCGGFAPGGSTEGGR